MALICAVGNVIYTKPSLASAELEMTMLDAVIMYAMMGLKGMALPLLIAYTNMHRFKYDFKYSYLIRSKSRLRIWYKHVINAVVDCIVVVAIMMAAGAVTGYIVCDKTVDFYSATSVCMNEFKKYRMSVPNDMDIPLMITEMYIVSVGELIARTLAAFLIYWLTDSRVTSIIGMYAMSYLSLGSLGIRGILLFVRPRQVNVKYYSALYFPSQVMETIMLLMVAIIFILLTAQIFVPVKEFIKR